MEFSQAKAEIKKSLDSLAQTDKLLLVLAREMWTIQNERIFNDGILTNGSKIVYNTNPILVGKSSFAKKSAANAFFKKRKKLRGSNRYEFSTERGTHVKLKDNQYTKDEMNWVTLPGGVKLVELQGGFKKLKELNGVENPFDFTHQLKKSFFWESRKGEGVIGFLGTKRLTPDGKATTTTNKEVADGLEEMKGTIFQMTASEEKEVDNIINDYLDEIFK
jgi:hypothetical protein